MSNPETIADYVVRAGTDEVMVAAPSGHVEFMSLWGFILFTWAALWAGKKIEVADDEQS